MFQYPVVLDENGEIIAMIDDFTSATWVRRLRSVNEFSLVIPPTSRSLPLIVPGVTILMPDDPPLAYFPLNYNIVSFGAESQMEIVGPSLDGLFGSPGRVALPEVGMAHDQYNAVASETIMKELVNVNAGPGAAVNRRIPRLTIAPTQGRGTTETVWARYQSVLYWLETLASINDFGWHVEYDPDTGDFVFEIVEGEDKTDTVVLDTALESLLEFQWVRTEDALANYAYAAGEGDGILRLVAELYTGMTEPTGFDRREVFAPAPDISDANALTTAGMGALEETTRQESFGVTINPAGPYTYRTDWDLGDTVKLRSARWGLERDAQIVSITSSIDGATLRPIRSVEIGKSLPTRERAIIRSVRSQMFQRMTE